MNYVSDAEKERERERVAVEKQGSCEGASREGARKTGDCSAQTLFFQIERANKKENSQYTVEKVHTTTLQMESKHFDK